MQGVKVFGSRLVLFCFFLAAVFLLASCAAAPVSETASSPDSTPGVTVSSGTAGQTAVSDTTAGEGADLISGNGGPVLQWGDWLFFAVAERQALDQTFGLYRMQSDGTGLVLLCPGFQITRIYGIDGWLYFIESTTVEDGTPVRAELKKIRPDGSGLATVLGLDGKTIERLQAEGDWLYLSCRDTEWRPTVRRVRTDGSGLTTVVDGYALAALDEAWFYTVSEQGEMVRLARAGQTMEQLGTGRVAGGDFCLAGGWLYYASETDAWNLYRMRTDGSDSQRLTMEPAVNFYLDGAEIFYQVERTEVNPTATGGEVVRLLPDGSGRVVLADITPAQDGLANLAGAAGGWLYVHEMTWDEKTPGTYRSTLYRQKSDGSARQDLIAYACINAG